MGDWLVPAISVLLVASLVCFSARRLVLLVAALLPVPRRGGVDDPPPKLTLLVPARNEGAAIEPGLAALARLRYPSGSLSIVLVDDASSDDTGARLDAWAGGRSGVRALHLSEHAGKGGALNVALAAAPESELIAICDADLRPRPESLLRLVAAFDGNTVGGAAAYLRPVNAASGIVSGYAALETWTHQLVTSAGKDRLALNPPLLGACAYRRRALESIGGFRPGGPGEDVHSTLALTRGGWRTRFVAGAVVENTVASGWRDYWRQHIRWSRNLYAAGDAAGTTVPDRPPTTVPLLRRAEGWIARSGYADRLAFAGALAMTLFGALTLWPCAAYAAIAAAEAATAAARAGEGHRAPRYLLAAVVLFPLDVAASAAAAVSHLVHRPRTWRTARRSERAPERA